MSGWGGRLRGWLRGPSADGSAPPGPQPLDEGAGAPASGAPVQAQQMPPAPDGAAAGATDPAVLEREFFQWLTAVPVVNAPMVAREQQLLVHLDTVLFSDEQRALLLPRARAIVPQLLASLRDESQSNQDLAGRVARDQNLVVEVIRMANSVGYRGQSPVVDLMHAISRLGTEGLRRAVARVLLKPIFDAQTDVLLGRAAERLWQHSEIKAGLCLQQALIARLDPFEAYLAGLMHNVGWTAALRAIDHSPEGIPEALSATFVRAFAPRRDRLFATFVRSWELSASLTALANEILSSGFLHARSQLAQLLDHADRAACCQMLGAAAPANADGAGA